MEENEENLSKDRSIWAKLILTLTFVYLGKCKDQDRKIV